MKKKGILMFRNKIHIAVMFFVSLIFLSLIFCLSSCSKKEIHIDTGESFFSSFHVENDKVYIRCQILIKNPGEEEKCVALIGSFDRDAENGLLKEPALEGYSIDCETKQFNLEKGDNWLEVVFIGEYAGNNQKHDRLLPEIQITELE